jgi:hypothetical protein
MVTYRDYFNKGVWVVVGQELGENPYAFSDSARTGVVAITIHSDSCLCVVDETTGLESQNGPARIFRSS